MDIIRAATYRRMPWKNGKGETIEIAVSPEGASTDNFDWRISMAPVVADGPFSTFEDIDRTLSILTGSGMALSVEGIETVVLGEQSAPFSFAGDAPTTAALNAGPITDLNVMTRRGKMAHRVSRLAGTGSVSPAAGVSVCIVVPTQGCRIGARTLGPLDAAIMRGQDIQPSITIDGNAPVFFIEIGNFE